MAKVSHVAKPWIHRAGEYTSVVEGWGRIEGVSSYWTVIQTTLRALLFTIDGIQNWEDPYLCHHMQTHCTLSLLLLLFNPFLFSLHPICLLFRIWGEFYLGPNKNFYVFNLLFASFLVIFKYIDIFGGSIQSSITTFFSLIFTSKNKCVFGKRGETEQWLPHPMDGCTRAEVTSVSVGC